MTASPPTGGERVYVVATAGHVDHGKSALIRALTGMEPDRLQEEQQRGRSIDLGFCWTSLPGRGQVAFVDVPGHERYLGNALAGLGPSQAVLLVVAADDGVKAQTSEHLSAVDALGIGRGVVAVNRCDLADPGPARAETARALAGTSLASAPVVPVSARTGHGLAELRARLGEVLGRLPAPDQGGPARLWVDRVFTVPGAGTVVTGTLVSGRVADGCRLAVPRTGATVTIRGLQCLREPVTTAGAASRVAVNLRRVPASSLRRGDALLSLDGWLPGSVVDVRHRPARLPRELVVHIGTAAVPATVRPLDRQLARLRLTEPVGLHVGERLVLRASGTRTLVSAVVLDPHPPALPRRRGAAAARAGALAATTGTPDPADELRRRGLATGEFLAAIGVPAPGAPVAGDWHVDPDRAAALRRSLAELAHTVPDLPPAEAARRLGLPDPRLVSALAPAGFASQPAAAGPGPAALDQAILDPIPPDRLGLGRAELAAALSSGALVRIGRGYLPAATIDRAIDVLRGLPQPFTVSQARQAFEVSRAVTLPLLQHLDRAGITRCLPDHTRCLPPI